MKFVRECPSVALVLFSEDPYYFLQYDRGHNASEVNLDAVEEGGFDHPFARNFIGGLTPSFLSMDVQGRVLRIDRCVRVPMAFSPKESASTKIIVSVKLSCQACDWAGSPATHCFRESWKFLQTHLLNILMASARFSSQKCSALKAGALTDTSNGLIAYAPIISAAGTSSWRSSTER